jgi:hypothetical protein
MSKRLLSLDIGVQSSPSSFLCLLPDDLLSLLLLSTKEAIFAFNCTCTRVNGLISRGSGGNNSLFYHMKEFRFLHHQHYHLNEKWRWRALSAAKLGLGQRLATVGTRFLTLGGDDEVKPSSVWARLASTLCSLRIMDGIDPVTGYARGAPFLSQLTALRALELHRVFDYDDRLSDLVAPLTRLEILHLGRLPNETCIGDYSVFGRMTSLQCLILEVPKLKLEFSMISGLTNLEHLYLGRGHVTTEVTRLTKLKCLYCHRKESPEILNEIGRLMPTIQFSPVILSGDQFYLDDDISPTKPRYHTEGDYYWESESSESCHYQDDGDGDYEEAYDYFAEAYEEALSLVS